jgi:tetratricopeptide (TPR) repeat protein
VDSERFEHANSLRLAGKEQDALHEFEALTSGVTDPCEKSSLLLGQATCLLGLGRVKEARQRWSEATRYWTNLYTEFIDACLCAEEGNRQEALERWMRFLEKHSELREPGNEDTYSDACERLGVLLFEVERYADAVRPLTDALALAETDERRRKLCSYLGICHLENGTLDAAEQRLTESLPASAHDPLWARVQYELGRLYFRQGAYIKAKMAFEFCEVFACEANTELKQNVSGWLARIAPHLPSESRKRQ